MEEFFKGGTLSVVKKLIEKRTCRSKLEVKKKTYMLKIFCEQICLLSPKNQQILLFLINKTEIFKDICSRDI